MVRQREVVGRRVELDALTRLLGALTQGLSVATLRGPAGMGKTTIWSRGLELAAAAGARVLSTRPCETETRLSYVGLSDLLENVEDGLFAQPPGPVQQAGVLKAAHGFLQREARQHRA